MIQCVCLPLTSCKLQEESNWCSSGCKITSCSLVTKYWYVFIRLGIYFLPFFFCLYIYRYPKASLTFLHFVQPAESSRGEAALCTFLLGWQKCPKQPLFFSGSSFLLFLSWPYGDVCLSEPEPTKHQAADWKSWFNWVIMPSTQEAWWHWQSAVQGFGGSAASPAPDRLGPDDLTVPVVGSHPTCEQ